MKAMAIQPFI